MGMGEKEEGKGGMGEGRRGWRRKWGGGKTHKKSCTDRNWNVFPRRGIIFNKI